MVPMTPSRPPKFLRTLSAGMPRTLSDSAVISSFTSDTTSRISSNNASFSAYDTLVQATALDATRSTLPRRVREKRSPPASEVAYRAVDVVGGTRDEGRGPLRDGRLAQQVVGHSGAQHQVRVITK